MSNLIKFTNNYRDCSTDAGYQFEFNCDGCGTGLMSPFKPSKLGVAGSVLRTASSFFGGLGGATQAADGARDLMRGKERDQALQESVADMKKVFKLCGRCGKWVCPEACWNDKKNLCEKCAPDLEEELVNVQETAKVAWMQRKAHQTDMIAGLDITQDGGKPKDLATCPKCNASVNGKFCPECGTEITRKAFCANCGVENSAAAKFCGNCGQKMG
jgi:hypothetical protein